MRAEPDELALAHVDFRLKLVGKFRSCMRIQAIRGHHQIEFLGIIGSAGDIGLKPQLHAELFRPCLQQQQQLLASDAAETMPGRHGLGVLEQHRDIVPIGEMLADRCRAHRIVFCQIVQGLVGQYNAPAESVIRLVALNDHHFMRRVAQLHRDCEIETGRTATQTNDSHLPHLLAVHH